MNPSSIFCEYIYGTFLLVEAAMESYLPLAISSLHNLNAAFDAVLSFFRFTIDLAIETVLNAVRVLEKRLVDLLWDGYVEEEVIDEKTGKKVKRKKSGFCNNLYKCNIFIEELTDSNSLIFKTLKKMGVVTDDQQNFINSIISDYDDFKDQICNYGFTFTFGLSAIKKILNFYDRTLNGFLDMIERRKEAIRRMIQSYIDQLINWGIFDCLAKLKKFFNCVLDETDSCASISSTKNYYTDCLARLHIEDSGNGNYSLESSMKNKIDKAFDSRINAINNAKSDLQKAVDALVSPTDTRAASLAFDISKNIFPGGMNWTNVKNRDWKNNRMHHYFSVKTSEFIDAFLRKHSSGDDALPADISTEYILAGMKMNDTSGVIQMNVNNVSETIDVNDSSTMSGYSTSMLGWTELREPVTYMTAVGDVPESRNVFSFNGQIISALRAAVSIAVENAEDLKSHCREKFTLVNDMISENEVVTEV